MATTAKAKYDPKGQFEVLKRIKHPAGPHGRRKVEASRPGSQIPNPYGGQEVGYFIPGEMCSFPHFVEEPEKVEFLVDVVCAIRPLAAGPLVEKVGK